MQPTTVGQGVRMLVYLEQHGRVHSAASFQAQARRGSAKRRGQRPYARRKPKAYEAKGPGTWCRWIR